MNNNTQALMMLFCLGACSEPIEVVPHGDAAADAQETTVLDVSTDTGGLTASSCAERIGSCSPLTNDGCSAGQGCYPVSVTQFECANSMGRRIGASCTRSSECAAGSFCFLAGSVGHCAPWCCPESDQCGQIQGTSDMGLVCTRRVQGFNSLALCTPTRCEPTALSDNGCPGYAPYCFTVRRGGTLGVECGYRGAQEASPGQACMADNACPPGYYCVGDTSTGLSACRRRCRTAEMSTCSPGEICVPDMNLAELGLGYCVRQ